MRQFNSDTIDNIFQARDKNGIDYFINNEGKLDLYTGHDYGRREDWRERDTRDRMQEGDWRAYFAYLRNENQVYSGDEIIRMFRNSYGNSGSKKDFFKAQPPLSPTDRYAAAVGANGVCYLVNKANPRNSYRISETSGKLIAANIPTSMARQLTGATPDAGQATPALADKQGKRFVPVSEPAHNEVLNISTMKLLTGGDEICARPLYGPMFYYMPQFKMILACNNLPTIPSLDGGTWRRIVVLAFDSKFVDADELIEGVSFLKLKDDKLAKY